ncbi:hypothetical protein LCM20_00320 [Halobacillus litoralis]|uniref:hypothetical protein n=1 Tax=Halobacillus litoralis TaxID=45668 RepID=UPI001CD5AF38|nr:hypothetical protein [Halobacillus litoralis]MCA0969027.1 hypothetical protein [Halobacillus litoralis]
MAFGLKREELMAWKRKVKNGEIAFLTHFWIDERFPGCDTVTKVGSSDLKALKKWGKQYGLRPEWIHQDPRFPHFDLFGETQYRILKAENQLNQIERFNLKP